MIDNHFRSVGAELIVVAETNSAAGMLSLVRRTKVGAGAIDIALNDLGDGNLSGTNCVVQFGDRRRFQVERPAVASGLLGHLYMLFWLDGGRCSRGIGECRLLTLGTLCQ
jgi:hypothetical protein